MAALADAIDNVGFALPAAQNVSPTRDDLIAYLKNDLKLEGGDEMVESQKDADERASVGTAPVYPGM